MKFSVAGALVIGLVFAGQATAQFYKYIDKQGYVRFTDDINRVPEDQRSRLRSYTESQGAPAPASEPDDGPETQPGSVPGPLAAPASPQDSAADNHEALESAHLRIQEMKKNLDVEYQALLKEKETLSKERDTPKTREETVDYNKRIQTFNQNAAKFENRSDELRKMVDDYNLRVIEGNSNTMKSRK